MITEDEFFMLFSRMILDEPLTMNERIAKTMLLYIAPFLAKKLKVEFDERYINALVMTTYESLTDEAKKDMKEMLDKETGINEWKN